MSGQDHRGGDVAVTTTFAWYPTGPMRWMRRGTGGHEWDYRYTVDGERVVTRQTRAVGDEILTYTLRDLEGKPLRTYRNANGTWLWEKDYVYRGRLLLATAAPAIGVRHVHVDHLGTPRFFTDRGKREAGYHALFPFGEECPAPPTTNTVQPLSTQWDSERLRFTGHERDLQATLDAPADDLDYMHARYYNPNLGRFLSVDRGAAAVPAQPQKWNRYSYTDGNPLKFLDPDGNEEVVFGKVRVNANPGDVFVFCGSRPGDYHVGSFVGGGKPGEIIGVENRYERNANLSEMTPRTAELLFLEGTGSNHPPVNLIADTVNGKPNPYSPANGGTLLGVVKFSRVGSPPTSTEVAGAAKGIQMYYSPSAQCTTFTIDLASALGGSLVLVKLREGQEKDSIVRFVDTVTVATPQDTGNP